MDAIRSSPMAVLGPVQTPGGSLDRDPRPRGLRLGVVGAVSVAAVLAGAVPASAETYYTGQCSVTGYVAGSGNDYYRTFQAAIVGSIEQGTGKYIWNHYNYRYQVDPHLTSGGSSDEVVGVVEGYDSGLSQTWASPDNHGSTGDWLAENNWKGAKSYWGYTKVKFHAAFDIPGTPDPHCDAYTARV